MTLIVCRFHGHNFLGKHSQWEAIEDKKKSHFGFFVFAKFVFYVESLKPQGSLYAD